MSKKGPENIPHSASWHQHRNKFESREYWSKVRARNKEEDRDQFQEWLDHLREQETTEVKHHE